VGAGAVAVLVAKERRIVEAFRRAGAIDPRAAVVPSTIGVAERLAFRKLRQHAVLREVGAGAFYLDEPSWEALRSMRRRLGLICLLLALTAAVAVWMRNP
jgi:hypothetical protein